MAFDKRANPQGPHYQAPPPEPLAEREACARRTKTKKAGPHKKTGGGLEKKKKPTEAMQNRLTVRGFGLEIGFTPPPCLMDLCDRSSLRSQVEAPSRLLSLGGPPAKLARFALNGAPIQNKLASVASGCSFATKARFARNGGGGGRCNRISL